MPHRRVFPVLLLVTTLVAVACGGQPPGSNTPDTTSPAPDASVTDVPPAAIPADIVEAIALR